MNWFDVAKGEIGVKEIPGETDNPRIIEYDKCTRLKATDDETPWCSAFVNWCVVQVGLKGTNSAAARSWLDWGVPIDTPKEGCIVILKRGLPPSGHVTFFDSVCPDPHYLHCLGGNQSDQVKYSNYPISDVLGYRWPEGC